jgi:hypothetical protein
MKRPESKPDLGNPTVRDCRGASGNVILTEGLWCYSDGKEYKERADRRVCLPAHCHWKSGTVEPSICARPISIPTQSTKRAVRRAVSP